jgi:large subunit ribosomal protein L11
MDMMKSFGGADVKIKCKLTIFADRTFTLELGKPVTSNLILWKIGQKVGSGEPNKKNIGKLTRKDLEEIAEIKRGDMNTEDIEAMIKII